MSASILTSDQSPSNNKKVTKSPSHKPIFIQTLTNQKFRPRSNSSPDLLNQDQHSQQSKRRIIKVATHDTNRIGLGMTENDEMDIQSAETLQTNPSTDKSTEEATTAKQTPTYHKANMTNKKRFDCLHSNTSNLSQIRSNCTKN